MAEQKQTLSSSSSSSNKRNYIRKKKYLADCISKIQATLDFVHLARGEKIDPSESQRRAMESAQAIEAVCWSPQSRLSADGYQRLMTTKTQELCRTIIKKSLPSVDLNQLQKLTAALISERAHTPQPTLPLPIIPGANTANSGASSPGNSPPSTSPIVEVTAKANQLENDDAKQTQKKILVKIKTENDDQKQIGQLKSIITNVDFGNVQNDRCSFVPSFESAQEDIFETSPFLNIDENEAAEIAMMRIDRNFESVDFPFTVV